MPSKKRCFEGKNGKTWVSEGLFHCTPERRVANRLMTMIFD